MTLDAVNVLGISVTSSSKKTILEEIEKYLFRPQNSEYRTKKNLIIYTPNVEQIVRAQTDVHFAEVLNRADVALPDSGGVVWASRVLTQRPIATTIPGVEFMEDLVALAAKRRVPIRLIGGGEGVAVKAFECLRRKYPDLIHSDQAQIVFVALGAPKQEYYIEKLRTQNTESRTPRILMAVGGSFDIIAGLTPRAPVAFRSLRVPFFSRLIGFEWAWRLALQPWRIVRQLALVQFVWLVLKKHYFPGRS